jgi:hypothetical protein
MRYGPGSTVLSAQAAKIRGRGASRWATLLPSGGLALTLLGGEGRNRPQFVANKRAIPWSKRAHEASEGP